MKTAWKMTSPVQKLSILYILALSTIAFLILLGQLMVWLALQQQSNDALIINMAGRQRMLSQKISKAALVIQNSPDPTVRQAHTKELADAIHLWVDHQRLLQYGNNSTELHIENTYYVKSLYHKIEPHYKMIVTAAQRILVLSDDTRQVAGLNVGDKVAPFVNTILTHENDFLVGMDAIVLQYQQEAEKHINEVKFLELGSATLALLILLVEGLCIFRPAIRKLKEYIHRTARAEETIELDFTILEQKQQLEKEIEQLLQTHIRIANGDLAARAPQTKDHALWQVSAALNLLLTRYQRVMQDKNYTNQSDLNQTVYNPSDNR